MEHKSLDIATRIVKRGSFSSRAGDMVNYVKDDVGLGTAAGGLGVYATLGGGISGVLHALTPKKRRQKLLHDILLGMAMGSGIGAANLGREAYQRTKPPQASE